MIIGSIVLIYISWLVTSLILCLIYSPEQMVKDYGKGIYIIITLPWQILGWIYEPIHKLKFKIKKRINRKKGRHGYGYEKEDKFDYKW